MLQYKTKKGEIEMDLHRKPAPEDFGIFRGFSIKYPEYSIILPQSGYSFSLRSMNVSEVNKIKSSLSNPLNTIEIINKMIWECIVSKPKEIGTYVEFLNKITLKDREALLYALYVISFGRERDFGVNCKDCGAESVIPVDLEKVKTITPYLDTQAMEGKYILEKNTSDISPDLEMEEIVEERRKRKKSKNEEEINQDTNSEEESISEEKISRLNTDVPEILKKVISLNFDMDDSSEIVCYIHQPTLQTELDIFSKMPYAVKKQTDIINETIYIKSFEIKDKETGKLKMKISDREDIFVGYQQLPVFYKNKIFEAYKTNFSDFNIEVKANWICKSCGSENVFVFDPLGQFFRMVVSS